MVKQAIAGPQKLCHLSGITVLHDNLPERLRNMGLAFPTNRNYSYRMHLLPLQLPSLESCLKTGLLTFRSPCHLSQAHPHRRDE